VFSASAVHAAAGILLATEAGGIVSDIDGESWNVDSDSVLAAATPSLHAELAATCATLRRVLLLSDKRHYVN